MRPFLAALSVLSVLPLGKFAATEQDLKRALPFFPVAGLLFGALGWGAAELLTRGFPPAVAAMFCAVLPEALTKGFHLDGLADTADGFLSGRTRERKLEIMRDSRTGSMGVAAVFALLGLKAAACLSFPPELLPAAFGLSLLAGRCGLLFHIATSRYARPDGFGGIWFQINPYPALVPATLFPVAAGWLLFGIPGVGAVLAVLLCAALWSLVTKRVIGGATGDTIGCSEECSELLLLLALLLLLPR